MKKATLASLGIMFCLCGCSVSGKATASADAVSFNLQCVGEDNESSSVSESLTAKECKDSNLCLTDSRHIQFSASKKLDSMHVVVKVPFVIRATNGTCLGPNTVLFTEDDLMNGIGTGTMQTLYAADSISYALSTQYTASVAKESDFVLGVPSKIENFKSGGIYREDTCFKIISYTGIIHHLYTVDRNNRKCYKDITYDWLKPYYLFDRKNGLSKIHVVFVNGTDKVMSFYLDTVNPRYSLNPVTHKIDAVDPKKDKYHSGIDSITVNGKRVANHSIIKQRGKLTIVVTDKAGNSITKNEYIRKTED